MIYVSHSMPAGLCCQQPYNPAPAGSFDFRTDMDLTGNGLLWYARPQLFFRCTVCPTGSLQTPSKHKELALVFFSTLEPITLSPGAVTQRNGVPMLYDTASSSNLPSLYLCLARNVLGRVPLTPCFVRGNRTPTLIHSFGNRQGAVADSRNGAGNCSRLYEVNIWMWLYCRGQPRLVTVAKAQLQRKAAISDARRRAADTMKRRREERLLPKTGRG